MPHTEAPARAGQRLAQVVLDELRERLVAGRYPVGSRISIEEVKEEFGVSKQPVMDAMRRLEALGLVEIMPQSGCRVARYSLQEVADFFTLFGRFEGEVAAAAAARRTDAQLAQLDEVWARIDALAGVADLTERAHGYVRLNREFHRSVHEMAHSRVMADMSGRMWDLSDFFIGTLTRPEPAGTAVARRNCEHDVIRIAIRAGNVDVARAAMTTHILDTVRMFEETP